MQARCTEWAPEIRQAAHSWRFWLSRLGRSRHMHSAKARPVFPMLTPTVNNHCTEAFFWQEVFCLKNRAKTSSWSCHLLLTWDWIPSNLGKRLLNYSSALQISASELLWTFYANKGAEGDGESGSKTSHSLHEIMRMLFPSTSAAQQNFRCRRKCSLPAVPTCGYWGLELWLVVFTLGRGQTLPAYSLPNTLPSKAVISLTHSVHVPWGPTACLAHGRHRGYSREQVQRPCSQGAGGLVYNNCLFETTRLMWGTSSKNLGFNVL